MVRVTLLFVIFAASLPAQNATESTAKTSGPCSPAVSGNQNEIKITCNGISKDQAEQYLKILNTIAQNQLPADRVLRTLEDIKNGVNRCTSAALGRRLTDKQRQIMSDALTRYSNTELEIWTTSDAESSLFTSDLVSELNSIGWKVTQRTQIYVNGPPPEGILVEVNKEQNDSHLVPNAFVALANALSDCGLAISARYESSTPSGVPKFIVGMKPSSNAPN